uniref:SCP domain-containing protein n=1 Tax=Strongyloides papillosus TaxID=174720 RepID=A0A0N5BB21_STREA
MLTFQIIQHINLIRLKHGACPLQENEHLNELAQTFANNMAKYLYFNSKPFKGYGILHNALTHSDLTKVVSNWYSGRRFYSYNLNYKIPMAKDFTQMVWKSSSFIGVGVGRRAKYFYVVAFIYPKGNIKDHFNRNVFEKEISWKKLAQIS